MSATGEDQDLADALLVECELKGCAAPPGKACVNSVTGKGPRDEPHMSRVVKGRRTASGLAARGAAVTPDPQYVASLERQLSRADAALLAAERERDEAVNSFEETYADLAQARYERKQALSDLAVSQQDLTRVERERDDLREDLAAAQYARRVEVDQLAAELSSARQELQTLRARDAMAADTMRLFLTALGLDPDDPRQRPVMAARELRAELDRLRAHHCPTPEQETGHA